MSGGYQEMPVYTPSEPTDPAHGAFPASHGSTQHAVGFNTPAQQHGSEKDGQFPAHFHGSQPDYSQISANLPSNLTYQQPSWGVPAPQPGWYSPMAMGAPAPAAWAP